jgi:hypothetical protein
MDVQVRAGERAHGRRTLAAEPDATPAIPARCAYCL